MIIAALGDADTAVTRDGKTRDLRWAISSEEDLEHFMTSPKLVRAVEQIALRNWGDIGLRLLYVIAGWASQAITSGLGPQLFDLTPEQLYAAHIRLGESDGCTPPLELAICQPSGS